MHRSTQLMIPLMIHLAVIVPLVTASSTMADTPGGPLLHTNQEDLVRHSNQESGWQQLLGEPQSMLLPRTRMDPFAADLRDLLPDPWSHSNSPRMTTLPAGNIPGPGAAVMLGLAGLLGVRARRRRQRGRGSLMPLTL